VRHRSQSDDGRERSDKFFHLPLQRGSGRVLPKPMAQQ
jgi:hypothetical protein